MSSLKRQIIHQLRTALPSVQAIYLFGSMVTGHFSKDSDVDIAILPSEPLSTLTRWQLLNRIAIDLGRDVDLIDLMKATTVMQFQVVSTGERIFAVDKSAAEWWELKVYQLYLTLNDDRKPILDAIRQKGQVYGG